MAQGLIKTEADALQSILEWSADRPGWQRDALRRLVTQGELVDDDLEELTAICKAETAEFDPLAAMHVSAQQSGAPTIGLKKLRAVENVNALAQGQSLTFLPTGVTIVYGDNGAGKSGYVRILKNACRARVSRGREEPILRNIYEDGDGPQRAEIEYVVGAQSQKTQWQAEEASEPLLSEISVFDSGSANVHVEETNSLAYTPHPMKVLERLVVTAVSIKKSLDREIAAIEAQTPKSLSEPKTSDTTEAGRLLSTLTKDTKTEDVEALAALDETQQQRLAELSSDFAQDPNAAARRLRAQKDRLNEILAKLKALGDAASTDHANELQSLSADTELKAAAATLASTELLQDEPLEGVGTETWRLLWEAARTFSTEGAYQEHDFPQVGDSARCVLCHQELDPDASARLARFEAFVQDKTQQDEAAANSALSSLREKLWSCRLPLIELNSARRFIADELGDLAMSDKVRRFVLQAQWRLRAMLRANSDVEAKCLDVSALGLKTLIDDLEQKASALLDDEQSEARKALKAELEELRDRQYLAGVKDDVIAEIGRLAEIAKLNQAVKDTRPNAITAKNTALSEALITDRLRARFAKEVDHLDLAGLAIELSQERSQLGVSRFKIRLIESAASNAGDILSEGEFRCVALAGFLAELATNSSGSGIIFDDPVSSLDHLHREAIAKRLAKEGQSRQIIVFTHDLPFLFLLRNACLNPEVGEEQTAVALRHIQKRGAEPGFCRNEAPEKAQATGARLASMRSHLSNTRVQFDMDPDGTPWLATSRGIIDSLRQAWEQAVEDAISPVLRTFSSKVDTKGFAKLSAITEEDAALMRQHYGRCSELLHKASDHLNPTAPKPDDISAELDALEEWLAEVTARQKEVNVA